MGKTRLAIFASGTGTNTKSIIGYFKGDASVEVSLVVTNKPEAGVISVAEAMGVDYAIAAKAELADEELMMALLEEYKVDAVILAGWLLLVPEYLVKRFDGRMLNIHPALLPKFGGKGMWGMHVHNAVKAAGERESGITIHKVNAQYDQGAIVAQHKVAIDPNDEAEEIEQKVRKLELQYYPEEIKKFLDSI
ncbi:MAG: phosphoribosylglycinamide formyltransferase [Flavobacteriales bacterium]|nr:phosphoribosylglycinamide formyltransferase [Flavobacteriales bacterium]